MKQSNPVSGRDSHDMSHVIDVERKKMAEKMAGKKRLKFDVNAYRRRKI